MKNFYENLEQFIDEHYYAMKNIAGKTAKIQLAGNWYSFTYGAIGEDGVTSSALHLTSAPSDKDLVFVQLDDESHTPIFIVLSFNEYNQMKLNSNKNYEVRLLGELIA